MSKDEAQKKYVELLESVRLFLLVFRLFWFGFAFWFVRLG
jgi:hypothetical protein